MPRPLSNDIRERIILHTEEGKNPKEIAEMLLVGESSVYKIIKKYKETGSYESLPPNGGAPPKITEEKMQEVFDKVKEQPDITLAELKEALNLPIQKSALSVRLIAAGYTFKKKLYFQMHKSVKLL